MHAYHRENLCHDAVHGYIPFVSSQDLADQETSERQIIDHPWVQRLRHIHQLQTAWWVYPTAEHTRFQHVLGVMHLASRFIDALYDSLRSHCPDAPSAGYAEALLRMAGLLHDVGHGPFGHFFDAHFLVHHNLTHEILGGLIIRDELGPLLRGVRRTPNRELAEHEVLDPSQVAWLITRPSGRTEEAEQPRWLHFLRSLLSGIYTIDNMDFVLRDAYMSGYSQRSYDLDRILRYSFFSEHGLTIHERGVDALIRFMSVKAELFRTIYFHRTVRGIDLTLSDLFLDSRDFLFQGSPADNLNAYQEFTETSLLVDVQRWRRSADPRQRALGERWCGLMRREIPWRMVCQRTLVFGETDRERSSIFSDSAFVEKKLRDALPSTLKDLPLRVDIARHIHRPHTAGPASGQNFLFDPARQAVRMLTTNELFARIPVSYRICRIYAQTHEFDRQLAAALDQMVGGGTEDDLTNM